MVLKKTKEIQYIKFVEKRIREIEELVASWPYETKAFMRARLNQYNPRSDFRRTVSNLLQSVFLTENEKQFSILKDPEILTDWQRRFTISGQTNPLAAWNKILEKEMSSRDYLFLLSLLDRDLKDVHVPCELAILFEKIYRAFIRKEYISDPEVPNAPLLLLIGPSGSGKTATASQAVEDVIFANKILPQIDIKQKKEEILSDEPFWKTLKEVDPQLAMEMDRLRKLRLYKQLSKIPVIRSIFKKRIGRNLFELEEQGVLVDYAIVTPNDYQTALAGEPGNFFKKAMGDPSQTSIRHIEEAHSAFGRSENRQSGLESQQRTLIDTSNIVIDEIINGRRDCLLIATTDQPERFDPAIYRRFMEKGKIISISEFWKSSENLKQIVCLELMKNDISACPPPSSAGPCGITVIPDHDINQAVETIYRIFEERTLKITPAYVRKLISSIIEIKKDFSADFLQDPVLVRKAFELVAQNSYGDLFKKIVGQMDRKIMWEEYVGTIKDLFSEMANNSLFYGVSEEKGVVLNGPPGSGKTFLVRSWLSENRDVHDIATSPGKLYDPINPVDGAVLNLEKVYDIAKMIAPTMVFFDEGDSLAPKRSPSGGSMSDKLTNKFLNIIDGEIPLKSVFTVLTTNRLDILDPALIRSKRLKVMAVTGHLDKNDIHAMITRALTDVPLAPDVDAAVIFESAGSICSTPADYTAFVEKILSLRNTEYVVLEKFQSLVEAKDNEKKSFIKFNLKTLLRILDAMEGIYSVRLEIRANPEKILKHYSQLAEFLSHINDIRHYPLALSHILAAKEEIAQSPVKKGSVQLDEFLQAELSQEHQVGFIIGAGANDITGVLMPIATSLIFKVTPEKVIVTGAVSSSAAQAMELDMAVQMMQQSAREAFTMVINYFQSLVPKINMAKIIGEYLENYSLHHQMLSASYTTGGPSAGYAFAINTLSALLHIPVRNDFGITGAPWTKGVRRGEVGGSVIIGGHKKKAEKVLISHNRMYMPYKNFCDLEQEYLANYWRQSKDIIGVRHFGDLVPEVLWLGEEHEKTALEYFSQRIAANLSKYQKNDPTLESPEKIRLFKSRMRDEIEIEIKKRLTAIHSYVRNPNKNPDLSIEEILKTS